MVQSAKTDAINAMLQANAVCVMDAQAERKFTYRQQFVGAMQYSKNLANNARIVAEVSPLLSDAENSALNNVTYIVRQSVIHHKHLPSDAVLLKDLSVFGADAPTVLQSVKQMYATMKRVYGALPFTTTVQQFNDLINKVVGEKPTAVFNVLPPIQQTYDTMNNNYEAWGKNGGKDLIDLYMEGNGKLNFGVGQKLGDQILKLFSGFGASYVSPEESDCYTVMQSLLVIPFSQLSTTQQTQVSKIFSDNFGPVNGPAALKVLNQYPALIDTIEKYAHSLSASQQASMLSQFDGAKSAQAAASSASAGHSSGHTQEHTAHSHQHKAEPKLKHHE